MNQNNPNIAIVGAGAWGTALAICLAKNSHSQIQLYTRTHSQLAGILQTGENKTYLPNQQIPKSVVIKSLESEKLTTGALKNDIAILCVPMSALLALIKEHGKWLLQFTHLLIATKGLMPETLQLPQEVVRAALILHKHVDCLSHNKQISLGLISGPSFAKELAQCLPTAVTLAHNKLSTAQQLCKWLRRDHFRLYPSDDPIGVAASGALKNVLAVASGLSDGLGLAENARAALITRGLHEMIIMLESWGGRRETLYGLSGIGDILLTCVGEQSRNRQAGLALAHGKSIDWIRQTLGTVEGLNTALAAQQMAVEKNLTTPIIYAVAEIIRGKLTGLEAMKALMKRPLRENEAKH